jgi:hypothetical protein
MPALPVTDPAIRRSVLIEQIKLEEKDTTLWYLGWGLTWLVGAAFQFAQWPFTAPEDRASVFAWGAASMFGTVATLALTPQAVGASRRIEEGADVEQVWVDIHDDEVINRSWFMHVGSLIVNTIPFLLLGLKYHRWDWPYFLLGIAFGEAQIATFPQLLRAFGTR